MTPGDKYHKGRVRSFCDAKALGVIDKHILPLVELMNRSGRISTFASCQGHGFPFIRITPYVSFKTCQELAFCLDTTLRNELMSDARKLFYEWEVVPGFDEDGSFNYRICAPGIRLGSVRYATRKKINQDLETLCLITQKVLDHFKRQDIEIKPQKHNQENGKSDDGENEICFCFSALFAKGIN